jgi:hypothetical protein
LGSSNTALELLHVNGKEVAVALSELLVQTWLLEGNSVKWALLAGQQQHSA